MKRNTQTYVQLGLLVAILLMVNLLGSGYFFRLDLTENERYSLTDLSERTADTLNRTLSIQVYLGGDLPTEAERFKENVRSLLQEYKAYAGADLQYQFINPAGNNKLKKTLMEQGVPRVPIVTQTANSQQRTNIYPGAKLIYGKQQAYVSLLNVGYNLPGRNALAQAFLEAEAELEYKLTSTIRRLVRGKKRIVGLLTDRSQYGPQEMGRFMKEIGRRYKLLYVSGTDSGKAISNSPANLPKSYREGLDGEGIDVLVVPQSVQPFSERMKYEIDQFIMRGGRVLWLLDRANMDHNDFRDNNLVMARQKLLNLNDMFMNYGFRLNPDVVQDMRSYVTPVMEISGDHQRIGQRDWSYFPMLNNFQPHPITAKLSNVMMRYASTLDTLSAPGIEAIPLLRSSEFSRSLTLPIQINMANTIRRPPPRRAFQGRGERLVALALEGQFPSAFRGRKPPTDSIARNPPSARFLPKVPFRNKMIVVSDGEVPLPDHMPKRNGVPFDNLRFLMNGIDYLINDLTYIKLRNKQVTLRRLDPEKIKAHAPMIRLLNIGLPILLVSLFGVLRYALRRRTYQRPFRSA